MAESWNRFMHKMLQQQRRARKGIINIFPRHKNTFGRTAVAICAHSLVQSKNIWLVINVTQEIFQYSPLLSSIAFSSCAVNASQLLQNLCHSPAGFSCWLIEKKIASATTRATTTHKVTFASSLPLASSSTTATSAQEWCIAFDTTICRCCQHLCCTLPAALRLRLPRCRVEVSLHFFLIHVVMSGNLRQQLIVAIAALPSQFHLHFRRCDALIGEWLAFAQLSASSLLSGMYFERGTLLNQPDIVRLQRAVSCAFFMQIIVCFSLIRVRTEWDNF